MKNSRIKKGVFLVCILFALGGVQQLHAQFPGGPTFDDNVDDTPQAPISGFVGIALAAGAYFGAKKIKDL